RAIRRAPAPVGCRGPPAAVPGQDPAMTCSLTDRTGGLTATPASGFSPPAAAPPPGPRPVTLAQLLPETPVDIILAPGEPDGGDHERDRSAGYDDHDPPRLRRAPP